MDKHKKYFAEVLSRLGKMSGLLFYDSSESLKLISILTSTISSNIEINPDGFNMAKNQNEFKKIQFYSRTFIRNFFSFVEGITYFMRYEVIKASNSQIIMLDNKTIAKMQEKEFDNITGMIGTKNKFNSFKENLDLSFKQFSRTFNSDYKLNKGGKGWVIFNELLEARNQITHPKSPEGYILPEKIIKNMHEGAIWFTESTRGLINSCAVGLDKEEKNNGKS